MEICNRFPTVNPFSIDVNNYHLVFLGLNINSNLENNDGGINRTNTISEKDLKWLKYDLNNTKLPILMFCHYGIAEDNMNGNWWFSKDSERALLKNRKQIKEIIKKHNVLKAFLIQILNVNNETAEEEAKKMKHAISEDTVNKFSDYIKSIIKVDELKCNYSPENERCQNCIKLKKKK